MAQGNGISSCSMNGKLDTELIDVGTQANNCNGIFQQPGATNGDLQQPNNPGPGSNNTGIPSSNGNNGHGSNFSMNDWIRLNLLKSNTTNMLNKISG